MASDGTWKVYLAGEIHSDWRRRIADGVEQAGLPVKLLAPVTDHSSHSVSFAHPVGRQPDCRIRSRPGATEGDLDRAEWSAARDNSERTAVGVTEGPWTGAAGSPTGWAGHVPDSGVGARRTET